MALSGSLPGFGAGQFLTDLPSRGYFSSSAVLPSSPGALRVYICDHDTSPPDEQLIKTDPTNILIRSLTLKKAKRDLTTKEKGKSPVDSAKGKRPADVIPDENLSKKVNAGSGSANSRKDCGPNRLSDKDIQRCTVEKLRTLLKERGLPLKGKKEELIARLKRCL
eukprot:c23029_g1_i1 orf=198-692(+)